MKIGFACGVFDLFHAGHVLMLKECKDHCDYLLIAINNAEKISKEINPGKRKPFYSIEERKLIMENSKYVDEVVVYESEDELLSILKNRKIDIRFLGEDYKGKLITGADIEIPIYYLNRSHGFSSTEILNRIRINQK